VSTIKQPQRIVVNAPNQRDLASTPKAANFASNTSRIQRDVSDLMRSMERGANVYKGINSEAEREQAMADNEARRNQADERRAKVEADKALTDAFNEEKDWFKIARSKHEAPLMADLEYNFIGQEPELVMEAMYDHPEFKNMTSGLSEENRDLIMSSFLQDVSEKFYEGYSTARDLQAEEDNATSINHTLTQSKSWEEVTEGLETRERIFFKNASGTDQEKSQAYNLNLYQRLGNFYKANKFTKLDTFSREQADSLELLQKVLDNYPATSAESLDIRDELERSIAADTEKYNFASSKKGWQDEGVNLLYAENYDETKVAAWLVKGRDGGYDSSLGDAIGLRRKQTQMKKEHYEYKLIDETLRYANESDVTNRQELTDYAENRASFYKDTYNVDMKSDNIVRAVIGQKRLELANVNELVEMQPHDQLAVEAKAQLEEEILRLAPDDKRIQLRSVFSELLSDDQVELTDRQNEALSSFQEVAQAFDGKVEDMAQAYFPDNPEFQRKAVLYDASLQVTGDHLASLRLANKAPVATVSKEVVTTMADTLEPLMAQYPTAMQDDIIDLAEGLVRKGFGNPEVAVKYIEKALKINTFKAEELAVFGDSVVLYGRYAKQTYQNTKQALQEFKDSEPSHIYDDAGRADDMVYSMFDKFANSHAEIIKSRVISISPDEDLDLEEHVTVEANRFVPNEYIFYEKGSRNLLMKATINDMVDTLKTLRKKET